MRYVEFDGDAAGDYSNGRTAAQNRVLEFDVANRVAQEVYFTVVVEDTKNGQVFECDPQMVNRPI